MYRYFYKYDYSELSTDGSEAMLLHVRVYYLARKYQIESLKSLAMRLFQDAANVCFSVKTFTDTVKEAYDNTNESDKELRQAMVKVALENHKLLKDDGGDEFGAMMASAGEFGRDVFWEMDSRKQSLSSVVTFICPKFERFWKLDSEAGLTPMCPACDSLMAPAPKESTIPFITSQCSHCRRSYEGTIDWVQFLALTCPYCHVHCLHTII